MKLTARGRIQLDDYRAVFPPQTQPTITLPDYLINLSAFNTEKIDDIRIEPLYRAGHPTPIFVPHNQVMDSVTGGPLVDNWEYAVASLPNFLWDSVVLTGSDGRVQKFPHTAWKYEEPDAQWNADTVPDVTLTAHGKIDSQGALFFITRTIYRGADVDTPSVIDLQFAANFQRYQVEISNKDFARVSYSSDAGATWKDINTHLKMGSDIPGALGQIAPGTTGSALAMRVLLMNGVVMLNLGGETEPYLVPVASANPTEPPVCSTITGTFPAGDHSVVYTFYKAATDDYPDPQETAPSPAGTFHSDGTKGVHVAAITLPDGADNINYYVSSPDGYRLANTGTGAAVDIPDPVGAPLPQPPEQSTVLPVLTDLWVFASNFSQFSWAAHPTKWAVHGELRSNPQSLGFPPDVSTPPRYVIHGSTEAVEVDSGNPWLVTFPDESFITVTTAGAPTDESQQYLLEIDNPPELDDAMSPLTYGGDQYAKFTACVTRVTTKIDGIHETHTSHAVNVVPKDYSETQTFDPVGLTVSRGFQVTFDNHYGQWANQSGNIAISAQLGYAVPNTGLYDRYVGHLHTYNLRRSGGHSVVVAEGGDQMLQLQDTIISAPADMDGWNHYYAIGYLAQLSGIQVSKLAFASLIPDDPYSYVAGDTEPFFLPLGEGMAPWTPRDSTITALELMNYVRKPAAFLLFFDNAGMLHYQKWIPPNPASPAKVFEEGGSGVDNVDLSEFWDYNLTKTTRGVRNVVVLIGIDPYNPNGWVYLPARRSDPDSIDSAPGSQPPNYVGYKKPFCWVDARFATPDFASRSADRLIEMMRVPGLTVSFETWMQPQLNVMDVIYVREQKAGAAAVPFYVMGLTNTWYVADSGEQKFRSTIRGRYLAGDTS